MMNFSFTNTLRKLVLVVFFAVIGYVESVNAGVVLVISNLQVTNFPNGDFDCPTDNGGCTIYANVDPCDIECEGINYRVTGTIASAYKNKGTGNVSMSGANYTFPKGTITVTAGQYPGVPPMTIDLTGVTTNSSGQFSFLKPM